MGGELLLPTSKEADRSEKLHILETQTDHHIYIMCTERTVQDSTGQDRTGQDPKGHEKTRPPGTGKL